MNAKFGIIGLSIAAMAATSGVMAQQAPQESPTYRDAPAEMNDIMATGVAADLGTTALGLALGFTEANPIGLALVPLKFVMKQRINSIDDESARREASAQFAGVQFGAAAANLCTLAIGNPIATLGCLAVGMALGYDRVKSVPIAQDCVDRHITSFEEAAHSGRVYRLNTVTCVGRFENAPTPAKVEVATAQYEDLLTTLAAAR